MDAVLTAAVVISFVLWLGLAAAWGVSRKKAGKENSTDGQVNAKKGVSMAQFDTHFFFATLTAVVNLCDRDPKLAKQITLDFTKFVRTQMELTGTKETVPFAKELEHTQTYLAIQKARFKERVNVEYDLAVMDFKLPPLTLQPLVENAVKHGITMKSGGGTVWIRSREDDKNYLIGIEDDGVGFDVAGLKSKDTAIADIHRKLSSMTEGKMEITTRAGGGTSVMIRIPKK